MLSKAVNTYRLLARAPQVFRKLELLKNPLTASQNERIMVLESEEQNMNKKEIINPVLVIRWYNGTKEDEKNSKKLLTKVNARAIIKVQ